MSSIAEYAPICRLHHVLPVHISTICRNANTDRYGTPFDVEWNGLRRRSVKLYMVEQWHGVKFTPEQIKILQSPKKRGPSGPKKYGNLTPGPHTFVAPTREGGTVTYPVLTRTVLDALAQRDKQWATYITNNFRLQKRR